MRGVVQRVLSAKVRVHDREIASIGKGILVFLAVQSGDSESDGEYLARKISGLRIFPSADGKRESDRSVAEIGAEICLVPQFTLMGDARKGNRPSYSDAEKPEVARELFFKVFEMLNDKGLKVAVGPFKDHMHVEIQNDGPYTVILDSRKIF